MGEVIHCVLFSYRLCAKILVFPVTPIHNYWILLALIIFNEQVDRKSFWHKINREGCCNGLSVFKDLLPAFYFYFFFNLSSFVFIAGFEIICRFVLS